MGAAVRVAVPPRPAGTFQEGLALSVDMQLLPGVHHLRRVAVRPKNQPQRHHLTVSSFQWSFPPITHDARRVHGRFVSGPVAQHPITSR